MKTSPSPRKPPVLNGIIRVCPGGRHAWFAAPWCPETGGKVRKPLVRS